MNNHATPQDVFVRGQLINLIRREEATTRPALEQRTGLGRRVVAQRVQQAIDVGLVDDSTFAASDVGRPSRQLRFRDDAGAVYVGMLEPARLLAAVATLSGELIDSAQQEWESSVGPDRTLEALHGMFSRLERRTRAEPWAIGIGVSGTVDFERGRVLSSPALPGWDGFSVRSWLRDHYDVPVWVDRDVNLMALGEWSKGSPRTDRDLMYVLVDEEVGAAVVTRGQLFRGDTGAAGQIGHVRVTDDPAARCRCGLTGCLEALVSAWSIAERVSTRLDESPFLRARARGTGLITARDVSDAAQADDATAIDEVAQALRVLGKTLSQHVSFANPGSVVITGRMLNIGPWTIELVEQVMRTGLTEAAGADLIVRGASLNHLEGLVGGAILAVEQLFSPAAVGLWIDNGTPVGRAAVLQRTLVV